MQRNCRRSHEYITDELKQITENLLKAISLGYNETTQLATKKSKTKDPSLFKTTAAINPNMANTLEYKEVFRFIISEFDGARLNINHNLTTFLIQCDLATSVCTETDQMKLLNYILSRIVRDTSQRMEGMYANWKELRTKLTSVYGEQESFGQQLHKLANFRQKPGEDTDTFGSHCLEFRNKLYLSYKNVMPPISTVTDFINFFARQIYEYLRVKPGIIHFFLKLMFSRKLIVRE